jgi:hypothetical protein
MVVLGILTGPIFPGSFVHKKFMVVFEQFPTLSLIHGKFHKFMYKICGKRLIAIFTATL